MPGRVQLRRARLGRGLDAVLSCIGRPVPLLTTPIISVVRSAAVDGGIGFFHTDGVVRVSTPPLWSSVASTTYGFIISPPLATVLATIAMCNGTIVVAALAEPADGQQRQLSVKSSTSPKQLAAGAGRSIGTFSPMPHFFGPSTIRSGPSSMASLGERDVAAAVEDLDHVPPHAVPPKFWIGSVVCGGTYSRSSPGTARSSEVTPFSKRDRRRDDLEARARHVPLLVRVGEQRLAGQGIEERQRVFGLAGVVHGDVGRVEARVADHRDHRAGVRIHHHDRALARRRARLRRPAARRRASSARTLPVLSLPPNKPLSARTFCSVVSPISTSFCVRSSWVDPKLNV